MIKNDFHVSAWSPGFSRYRGSWASHTETFRAAFKGNTSPAKAGTPCAMQSPCLMWKGEFIRLKAWSPGFSRFCRPRAELITSVAKALEQKHAMAEAG